VQRRRGLLGGRWCRRRARAASWRAATPTGNEARLGRAAQSGLVLVLLIALVVGREQHPFVRNRQGLYNASKSIVGDTRQYLCQAR